MATRTPPARRSAAAAPTADPASRSARAPAARKPEPASSVLRRFRIVFNAIKGHFREVEKRAGISGAQFWALSVLREQPGLGVGGLAKAMDIHQSTASNLLRPLLENGHVSAVRGAADRRAVQLQVTAKGLRVLAKAPGPFTGILPQALGRLDPQTLARLDRDLGRLIDELGPAARGRNVPLGQEDGKA